MQKRNSYMQKSLIVVVCAGIGLLSSCSKLKSRDQQNQGVQAYKNGKYADAVKHFQEAVALDPGSTNALKFLATSYYVQWVPGAENPDNVKNHDMAVEKFNEVLKTDPNDPLALAMMAAIAYNQAQSGTPEQKAAALQEAMKWNQRRIEVNPKDASRIIIWASSIGLKRLRPSRRRACN